MSSIAASSPSSLAASRSSRPRAISSAESADILVYTAFMKLNRIRRVGNSNVVSLPRELDAAGVAVGAQVVIQQLPSGEVRLLPAHRVRQMVRDYGRRVVAENRRGVQILADHDQKT